MAEQFTSLTLNGKTRTKEHLLRMVAAFNSEIAVAGWEKNLYDFIGEWLSESPIIEVQTSGSTGSPYTFRVEKKKMVESAKRTGDFLDLKKNEKALLCLPLSFIAGKMMVVRAFVLGLDLFTVKPSSKPLDDLDFELAFTALTPMQLHYSLQVEDGLSKVNRIDKLILGGGGIGHELLNKINTLKTKVWHTYGMAETLTHVAMKRLNGHNPDDHFRALPGVTFQKDDRGCLVITAPWLSDQEIVTNDLVELHNETTFDFSGRLDNVINSGGIKISPEAIESKLAPHLNERFIITGLPDEILGQKITLVIEGKETPQKQILGMMDKAGLSGYDRPGEIRFMYHFPQTESGKIIRRQVIEHLLEQ